MATVDASPERAAGCRNHAIVPPFGPRRGGALRAGVVRTFSRREAPFRRQWVGATRPSLRHARATR